MATVPGLNLKGGRWHLCVIVPKELQAEYGKTKINRALGTSDKAEANRRGLRKRAEWLEEFETKRRGLNAQCLEVITPELAQVLADGARNRVLQADQHRREGSDPILQALSLVGLPLMRDSDGSIPLPERSPLDGLSDWEMNALTAFNTTESQKVGRALAGRNLRTVLPLLQTMQKMRVTLTYGSEADALAAAKAELQRVERGLATFELELALGAPEITPQTPVTVAGYKAQIDGTGWLVKTATHTLSDGGLTTRLEMERLEG